LVGGEFPLAGFLAPDGEEAERETHAPAAGFGEDVGTTGHRDGVGMEELKLERARMNGEVAGFAFGDGGEVLGLGLNAAVGVGVDQVGGEEGIERGGVALEGGGDASGVGGADLREGGRFCGGRAVEECERDRHAKDAANDDEKRGHARSEREARHLRGKCGASGVEAGHGAEFVGDGAVVAGAGELVLIADAVVVAHPVGEEAGHDEANDGRLEQAVAAAGGVVGVARGEIGVEFGGEERAGGGLDGERLKFDPPFVGAVVAAGERVRGERCHVEVGDGPTMTVADGDEGVGEIFFGNVFGKSGEKLVGAADVDEPVRCGGSEADDVAEHVAGKAAGRGDEEDVVFVGADAFERNGFGGERGRK